LASKPMKQYTRYGSVVLNDNRITAFKEKQFTENGLINGGVYIIRKDLFLQLHLAGKFSFVRDFLEAFVESKIISGYVDDAYFIDIGIPEDYEKANIDFMNNRIPFDDIDKTWTIFLDRDGVINKELEGRYVNHLEEFELYEGVTESLEIF